MQTSIKTYLNFVPFLQIVNWSVQSMLGNKFGYSNKYTFATIGNFIKKAKNNIIVKDNVEYKRITVKINNKGVILRDIERGENIGTKKQFIAKAGQFIISKIDARNGAFGVVPQHLEGAIVTNDFPLFDINTTIINPHFLVFITTTKEFIKFAQSCSSGTTNRQRMDIDMFLNQKIPLPPLSEQEKLVHNYYEKIAQAETLEKEAKGLEWEIERYLFDELGMLNNTHRTKKNKGLRLIDYVNLDKWGLDFIGVNTSFNNLYKEVAIKYLCKISSGGTPSRNRKNFYFEGTIPWIKTGELSNDIIYETEEKITFEGLKNSSAKLYKEGSIIIAMYGATIGKTAKLGISATTNQACAVLFEINNNMILTDFLWEYIQSQTDNLKGLAYGSAQPNLNAGIIADYLVPIPPLSKQQEIVNHITMLKNKIKTQKAQAEALKTAAEKEFETAIFG